ncbi:MAG: TIGR02680 family protein [Acidimicrobiales bacterium]
MSDALHPSRWRPSRAGIANVWEYDDQIFDFADGRLVLRGPNGSGKSNALALLVPFLFDGVMAASRMDSLGGGRSMRTLLLCLAEDERGKQFRHEKRTGYTWLEFARDGDHLTIGCGARASAQRDAEAWFFVTDRRPGIDLDLAPGRVPLSKSGLAEEIGADAVCDSAEAYRAAVDRALFDLGPHRYRNLVELLLVLRRPHLAGKLNLEHLSKVLSDGLAALDDQLIADVAASFEDLEAVQRDLRRLQEAHRTVQSFLPVYRRYLRASARTRAAAATQAAGALRAAKRRVAAAEGALAAADRDAGRIRQELSDCETGRQVAEGRQRALLESPAYRDASSLVDVEGRAADAEGATEDAESRLASAIEEHQEAVAELAGAGAALAQATTEVDLGFTAASESADLAGIDWTLRRDQIDAIEVAPVVRALGLRRRQEIDDVREALAHADRAAAQAAAQAAAATDAAEESERAEGRRDAAAGSLDRARTELADNLRSWAARTGVAELEQVVALAGAVGDTDAVALSDAVAAVLRPRREALAGRDARVLDLLDALGREHDELVAERQRVVDDPVPAPDRLATRPADRSGRGGAPLYACCDFAGTVPEAERAGLEAALEGAGMLDAWVGEGTDALDAWLRPLSATPGPSLADVFIPTPPADTRLTADVISAVLSSISLVEAGIAVMPDGRFHLGPLAGRFAKPRAEFIGATAREDRRQRLLADLDRRLSDLAARRVRAEQEQGAIAEERLRLDSVAASLPSAVAVLEARDALVSAVAAAKSSRAAATGAEERARLARVTAANQADHLRAVGAERRLPVTRPELSAVEAHVTGYDQSTGGLVMAVTRFAGQQAESQRAEARVERARGAEASRQVERDRLHRQAASLRARANELRDQLGGDVEAPLRELAAIKEELEGRRIEAERLHEADRGVSEQRGRARQEQVEAASAVAEHEDAATAASMRLDVLRRADVWAAIGGLPAPPAEPQALAGAVMTATDDVMGDADENALERSFRRLLDDLGHGHVASQSYVDHLAVVEITTDTGTFSVLWLAEELAKQITRQEELLSERDRDIFERHLLTRVSHALRELLNDADELVTNINRSLADRPTASGKSVQLRWELGAADPAVRAAIGLLRKTPELLGPDEREQLRLFFSTAIAQQRAEDSLAGYAEILRRVLDYRSWHAFVPHVRSTGGGMQRLTRTLFRNLSGGEQAVVLHLPLFAAAAAHYDAAGGSAPRLIALDEAFAGIDEGMRAELMGLLVRFDLDILLTGHELWGAYEQVPALMAYDLLRQPPLEGVSAFAVRWDGAAMEEV